MPISLTFTEGALTEDNAVLAGKRITSAFLRWHGLDGNRVMTPDVTNHISILPKNRTLSGGEPFVGAWIETKTPSFALNNPKVLVGFFKEATDIVEELSGGNIARRNIYANALHTVNGSWNMDGQAMTDEQLTQQIAKG